MQDMHRAAMAILIAENFLLCSHTSSLSCSAQSVPLLMGCEKGRLLQCRMCRQNK